MDTDIGRGLRSLLDVEGVDGGFVFTLEGELAAWDMPDSVDVETLDEVSAKLSRIRDAFLEAGEALESCWLRFGDRTLSVRVGKNGMLCVLARAHVHAPTLRIATRLVLRGATTRDATRGST